MSHSLRLIKILKSFWSSLLTLPYLSGLSQSPALVDSLENQLKYHYAIKNELGKNVQAIYDTTACDILFSLSRAYWGNSPDKALEYANQARIVAEEIGYEKGLGNALHAIGAIHFQKGDLLPALRFYEKALLIRKKLGDEKGIGNSYNNIGEVYRTLGKYGEALEHHLNALKVRENNADQYGIARSLNNIGLTYMNQGNDTEALKNYEASIPIAQKTGDKQNILAIYNNLGILYSRGGNYLKALKNYERALEMAEELGDRQSMGSCYTNIGNIYFFQAKYPEAMKNYLSSLEIAKSLGDKYSLTVSYTNIGNILIKENKFRDAAANLDKALSLSKETGSLERLKNCYESIASLDSIQGNYKEALEHYRLYILYRDSLDNAENTKRTLQLQMQYEFDKKETLIQAEQEKENARAREELQKQKLVRNGFIGGFGIVLLFAGTFFRQRNKISKEKKKSEEERLKSESEKKRSEALLLNILPGEVAEELKRTGSARAKAFTMVTVMFTDFKDFTMISEKVSAELLVEEIHTCFSAFDLILQKYAIEKIKTIGDAYLCASGLPLPSYTHAEDMIRAAFEIRDFMLQRKREKEAKGEIAFELRLGMHTGPLVAGIVGIRKYAYDIWGDTVNLAARMEQNSEVGKINISGSTYELVKTKFNCTYRGKIEAKNKGNVDMYFVEKSE